MNARTDAALNFEKGAAWDNPMGTDGFEFIEYAAPDPAAMARCSSAWASSRSPSTATRT
jgi:4-hydroxyphenylpyruvate dioxygenase-like putative hemolysin